MGDLESRETSAVSVGVNDDAATTENAILSGVPVVIVPIQPPELGADIAHALVRLIENAYRRRAAAEAPGEEL
ncbi:hypothetical protein ABT297_37885 [Dactylosporangium sp. NPDC000555]|uniref:hypothetical protein n=1 Tax=Dactylosporangium sp. NPDC000555 TaxID=3154260 RepID=UPI003317BB11